MEGLSEISLFFIFVKKSQFFILLENHTFGQKSQISPLFCTFGQKSHFSDFFLHFSRYPGTLHITFHITIHHHIQLPYGLD